MGGRELCPFQTIIVTSRGKGDSFGKFVEKDNLITIDWHTQISHNPLLYGISVHPKRFSYQLIKESGVFAINYIPAALENAAIICGTKSGSHVDKWKESGLTKEDCEKIDCSYIKEASGHVECEVESEFAIGDHVLFVGRVVHIDVSDQKKRLIHMGDNEFSSTK